MKNKKTALHWKVHTPNLLKEILGNPGTGILNKPIYFLGQLLAAVAERAIILDDPILNGLMLRLTLYEQGDPSHPEYYMAWEETKKAMAEQIQ
jgi:hypothetical protein